jgi:hypothetical protein
MVDGDIFQNIADYIRLGKDASDLLRQRSRRHFAASLLRSRYLPSHTPPSVPARPTKPITRGLCHAQKTEWRYVAECILREVNLSSSPGALASVQGAPYLLCALQ